ncbi:MAG: CoA transferase subunit A [Promethearchaeota archaeon]
MTGSENKVTTLKDAVSKNVNDGDHLILGNYTVSGCMALVSEVVRQKKKHLTAYSQSGVIDVEYLVAGGCVDRLVTTYVWVGSGGTSSMARGIKNKSIAIEDYSNFQYNARLQAGMYGFSFMQVLEGAIESDLFKKRTFMGDNKFKVIECPFTGKEVLLVPAANPDVCIVHVQRADKYGNAQYWGAMGSVQAAALSSKKIIVSCEEIVDNDVIKASPDHTIIPAYRTNAVVKAPWGALPNQVVGHYYVDTLFWGLFGAMNTTEEGVQRFLDDWVYDCKDHEAFIQKYIEYFGAKHLNSLRGDPYYSAPVNFGGGYKSVWGHNGKHRNLGIKYDEVKKIMKEEGLFYE